MKRRAKGKRALLNLPGHHSTAAIVAEIVEKQYGPEITLQISDCNRVVSLDCSVATQADKENTLHKIDTLIDCLRALRRAIVARPCEDE